LKFSIVVPSYNRGALLPRLIRSVSKQWYKDYELIIIDDGSEDDTEKIVASFLDDSVFYYRIENGERGRARNYGIRKASGDYITFVDSDDLIHENYLFEAFQYLSKNKVGFLHFGYDIRDTDGKVIETRNQVYKDAIGKLVDGNYMSCIGCFVKAGILEEISFSENRAISGAEDWLLWLRIAARITIFQSDKITATMVQHNDRSVLNFSEAQLLAQMDGVLSNLKEDDTFINFFGNHIIRKIKARFMSYIALHALIVGDKLIGIKYLYFAMVCHPRELFFKRTYACIKLLIR